MTRKRTTLLPPLLFCLIALLTGLIHPPEVQATDNNRRKITETFVSILTLVSNNYVEEVAADSLIEGAITGMLEGLDPHSNYIDPDRYERMSENYRGTFSGVGINFAIREGWLTVISAIEGGPSRKLGIRAGDVITHIDGNSAEGINQQEVFDSLRGERGTTVNVIVRRGGVDEPLDFAIVRDNILLQSVPYAFHLDPGIGYIRMGRFSATTSDELESSLSELESDGLNGLILDLRGNSGGYLHQAIAVVDKFISAEKMVVYTKGRTARSSEEYFSTSHTHPDFPIVVLINAGSASASEIVAGALQDWDRGLIAGHTSFGKGLVQQQYGLPNGGALLLTSSRYYTPSGRLIQRPYEAGERDEYYMRAHRLTDEDDDELESDGQSTTSEEIDDRPLFHTLIQDRPVFGGGGITPDEDIEELFLSSRINTELLIGRKYFDFVNMLVADKTVTWDKSFNDFVREYSVSDELMDRLGEYLVETEFEFEPDSLEAHQEEVRRSIRSALANHLWGDEQRYQILIQDDPAVHRAIDLLPAAKELLERSKQIEAMRVSSDG